MEALVTWKLLSEELDEKFWDEEIFIKYYIKLNLIG